MDYGLSWVNGYHGLWLVNMGYHGLWVMGYGLWVMGFGLWVMGHGSWVMVQQSWAIVRMRKLLTGSSTALRQDILIVFT